MASPRTEVPFQRTEPAPVLAAMEGLRVTGKGWVNLSPVLDDPPPAPAPLGRWFSGRGPAVPHVTWIAPAPGASAVRVGIEHGLGTRARAELERCGVPPPPGAVVRQDHPRRGLVVDLPASLADRDQLDWLLTAASALSRVQVDDRWVAAVYPG